MAEPTTQHSGEGAWPLVKPEYQAGDDGGTLTGMWLQETHVPHVKLY